MDSRGQLRRGADNDRDSEERVYDRGLEAELESIDAELELTRNVLGFLQEMGANTLGEALAIGEARDAARLEQFGQKSDPN